MMAFLFFHLHGYSSNVLGWGLLDCHLYCYHLVVDKYLDFDFLPHIYGPSGLLRQLVTTSTWLWEEANLNSRQS